MVGPAGFPSHFGGDHKLKTVAIITRVPILNCNLSFIVQIYSSVILLVGLDQSSHCSVQPECQIKDTKPHNAKQNSFSDSCPIQGKYKHKWMCAAIWHWCVSVCGGVCLCDDTGPWDHRKWQGSCHNGLWFINSVKWKTD